MRPPAIPASSPGAQRGTSRRSGGEPLRRVSSCGPRCLRALSRAPWPPHNPHASVTAGHHC
eukprot:1463673-Lingulodinium_polyedra.AAC.1